MGATVIDLTQRIEPGMQLFPLHSPTHVIPWAPRERYGWATNALFLNEHAGTHLDAPRHFIADGQSVDALDLARLTGPAVVADVSQRWPRGEIDARDLEHATASTGLRAGDALLLRTGAGERLGTPAYLTDYPGLTADGAQLLVAQGVRLVGTDAPSIDHPDSTAFPAHRTLLPAERYIVENLANLAELLRRAAGVRFTLHTFPLPVAGGTGSPIRAVAVLDPDA